MFDEFKSRGITTVVHGNALIEAPHAFNAPLDPSDPWFRIIRAWRAIGQRRESLERFRVREHDPDDTFASIPNRDTPFPATSIYPPWPYDAASTLRKTRQTDVIVDRAAARATNYLRLWPTATVAFNFPRPILSFHMQRLIEATCHLGNAFLWKI